VLQYPSRKEQAQPEIFAKIVFLGANLFGLWLIASGARRLQGESPSACRAPHIVLFMPRPQEMSFLKPQHMAISASSRTSRGTYRKQNNFLICIFQLRNKLGDLNGQTRAEHFLRLLRRVNTKKGRGQY